MCIHYNKDKRKISIHALAKRATFCLAGCLCGDNVISIHALAKRATNQIRHINLIIRHFNPRPRKEGDAFCVFDAASFCISIHALAKRATTQIVCLQGNYLISIHALAKRATIHKSSPVAKTEISIHALAKRATANLYNDYLYFEAKYHISDIFPL